MEEGNPIIRSTESAEYALMYDAAAYAYHNAENTLETACDYRARYYGKRARVPRGTAPWRYVGGAEVATQRRKPAWRSHARESSQG